MTSERESSGEVMDHLLAEVAHAPSYLARWDQTRSAPEFTERPPGSMDRLPEPGAVVDGKYRVEAVLGEGGMGVVFGAIQLNTGRRVALKWMRPERLGRTSGERARSVARFVREARLASRVEHPHRVEVYDVGPDPDAPYLVMEQLRGESLRERMDREGPISWEAALALLEPVFELLNVAHAAGVVHRDLKPDNLFLAKGYDGEEVAKVLDFGISRLADSEGQEETTLTRAGATLGTPAYMPLEQLRGARDVDARADVYALGVVLYELLAGERPVRARNAAGYAAAIASRRLKPLGDSRPELRGNKELALMRALAVEPEDRYPTVTAMQSALVSAGRDLPYRGERRPPWRLPTVLLGLLLAVGGSVLMWVQAHPATSTGFASEGADPGSPARTGDPLPAPPPSSSMAEDVARRATQELSTAGGEGGQAVPDADAGVDLTGPARRRQRPSRAVRNAKGSSARWVQRRGARDGRAEPGGGEVRRLSRVELPPVADDTGSPAPDAGSTVLRATDFSSQAPTTSAPSEPPDGVYRQLRRDEF